MEVFHMKRMIVFGLTALVVASCGGNPPASKEAQQGTALAEDAAASSRPGFTEYPIGDPVQIEGMNVAAVYFQPSLLKPEEKAGIPVEEADIHIEADISALQDNPYGFGFGQFVPYLTVNYILENKDTGKKQEGSFMPMNASDGSHYGANVKMLGGGKYHLTYRILAPRDFMLHADQATGVMRSTFWKEPLSVEWDFNFIPRKW
jgi:periplasmic iron binding protein